MRAMKFPVLGLFIVTSWWQAQGYMKGAPYQACTTLEPKHGKPPQETPSPYTFDVKPQGIKNGMNATVTISGNTPEVTFKGFLLQGRQEGTPGIVIVNGIFSQLPDSTKHVQCPGGEQNTVSHSDSVERSTVSFQWAPPENFTGSLKFTGTVVEGGQVHWCGIMSPVLLVE